MSTIREQAKNIGFQIVGNLARHTEMEIFKREMVYMDDDNNQYLLRRGILTIVTADGCVI